MHRFNSSQQQHHHYHHHHHHRLNNGNRQQQQQQQQQQQGFNMHLASVATAQANVFSKNGYTVPSVCRSGCMDRKMTETGPDRNRLQPDRWLQLPAFKIKRPPKDRLQWTGFRYTLKTHTFWAYFEEKRARNACDMAKTEDFTLPHILRQSLADSGGLKFQTLAVWHGPILPDSVLRSLPESAGVCQSLRSLPGLSPPDSTDWVCRSLPDSCRL